MKLSFVPALAVVMLAACGVDSPVDAAPVKVRSSLEATFEAAAREYQVPVGVLEALGFVETRLSVQPNLESNSGGVGLIQLSRRGGVDTLTRAMTLTHATEGQLRVDPKANVRGAAAVLRALFDASRTTQPALDANAPGDWYVAVSNYPGFDSAMASADYATDVFLALERGFEVDGRDGVIGQAPLASGWRQHAPVASSRRDALVEYPGAAAWAASPNFSAGRSTYEFVLIHTMQGSYSGTKSWFQNTASQVSSHYIVRSSDGEVTQMVEHANTAWHVQCYNSRSIGIEHEGYIADPTLWYTDAMYTESAKLTRWIADRHGIPKTRAGIIGHNEVPSACNTGGHTDPGSGWNWTKYMALINGGTPTTGTGVLIGAIYTNGNTANRVAGATVTAGGQTVTTGADGLYQFSLPPGSATATVTKAGFGTATVTRTVTANAQIWGSMEINAATGTGTLRGKVYAVNAANAADQSVAVSGATVTTAGQSVTTAADGLYSFTLAPGTYSVTATKAGFSGTTLSLAVTSAATTMGALGLRATTGVDTQAPSVAITFPVNAAVLDLGRIDLKGLASDDRGAVGTVKVALNGGASTDVPVINGAFTVAVQLSPGANTIVVSAADAAGNMGRATSTATFNAGVAGFVHRAGDETARLEGATIELRVPSSGAVASTVSSDATGTYYAPVMTVPADYLVVVRKAGFLTSSQTVTVPADARLALNVALTEGVDVAVDAQVTFVEPADGSTVTTDTVTVYGVVKGFDVTGVVVNGSSAELLGAGGFSATLPMVDGENVITAVAMGVTGQTVSGTLTLQRKALPGNALHGDAKGCGGCSTGFGFEALGLLALLPLVRRRRS